MNFLILYNSKIDPFGTHLAFSNSIAESANKQGHNPLIIDISRFYEEAYTALISGYFDAVHLEQSHGAELIKRASEQNRKTPPFFSLVRDMPFYPWINENIIKTDTTSKFFYVEPSAVDIAKKINKHHNAEYHPSLYTSSLLTNERFTKPSDRPIRNLYVGSYQDNNHYLKRIRKNKQLSTALDLVLETKTTPAHIALSNAFKRKINFAKESSMVELCFLINQVARSIRREEFLRTVAPQIPLTLVWNGKFPEGVKFHKDTKVLKPKNYAQTVKLMHHSSNMWMIINNFGSALSERQLTAAASGCIPFTTMNDHSEIHTELKYVFHDIDDDIKRSIELSRDLISLNHIHEMTIRGKKLDNFNPKNYIKSIEKSLPIKPNFSIRSSSESKNFSVIKYWEDRYKQGGNSGSGSYGQLAKFKAEVINSFIAEKEIQSILELGCGDGNQLALFNRVDYIGVDVSETIVEICKEKFKNDNTKKFITLKRFAVEKPTAELTLSLDVIYHLVDEEIYNEYMQTLFSSSKKYCIIYSCNQELNDLTPHMRTRKFTDWIYKNLENWKLIKCIPNVYPRRKNSDPNLTSISDFYIFEKQPT
ncbi:class I SAM-dependent methyltransferase [Halomonas sp. Bachu 37]|uniref:class I SAM-dependent methyltransferase n=1 Tax=Halomonas kashgarensis TaxID=3084920 RepID=UPI0032170890